MINYFKERGTDRIIRDLGADSGCPQYYDKSTKTWVPDFELTRIFFGGLDVTRITEQEMRKLVER